MQRRDKRDSNVSWSASQRRVTKRTEAYRPAVSIRLSRSLGFPTCLFLASPLSGPHERHERRPMASRKEQLSSLFFVAWTTQPLHEKLLVGFRRAKFTQRKTNRQKYFCGRSTPMSPLAVLKILAIKPSAGRNITVESYGVKKNYKWCGISGAEKVCFSTPLNYIAPSLSTLSLTVLSYYWLYCTCIHRCWPYLGIRLHSHPQEVKSSLQTASQPVHQGQAQPWCNPCSHENRSHCSQPGRERSFSLLWVLDTYFDLIHPKHVIILL